MNVLSRKQEQMVKNKNALCLEKTKMLSAAYANGWPKVSPELLAQTAEGAFRPVKYYY